MFSSLPFVCHFPPPVYVSSHRRRTAILLLQCLFFYCFLFHSSALDAILFERGAGMNASTFLFTILYHFFFLRVCIWCMRPYKRNLTPFSPNWIAGNLQCTSCVYIYAFCFYVGFLFLFLFKRSNGSSGGGTTTNGSLYGILDLSANDVLVCTNSVWAICVCGAHSLSISFSVCMAIGSGFIVFANAYYPI